MVLRVLGQVFSQARYIAIATLVAATALSVAILLPNTAILSRVLQSQSIGWAAKFSFLGNMYQSLFTNFTIFSALSTVAIAVLLGINTALLTYYIRRRRKQAPSSSKRGHAAGLLGTVSGLFGIGCAACGSVIISGALTLLGGGWLLSMLPLHGAEFGLLGVLLLGYSVYQLCKKISDPLVCPI